MNKFFLFIYLLLSLILLASFVTHTTAYVFESFKEDLREYLQEIVSNKFGYRLLSYSGFSQASFQDITLTKSDLLQDLSALVRTTKIDFNLRSALSGSSVGLLKNVSLNGLDLNINMRNEKKSDRDFFSRAMQFLNYIATYIPNSGSLQGKSLHITVHFPSYTLLAEDVSFRIVIQKDSKVSFSAVIPLVLRNADRTTPFFSSIIRVSFEFEKGFHISQGNVIVSNLQVFSNRIATQYIHFMKTNDVMTFFTPQDSAQVISLQGKINLSSYQWAISFSTNNALLSTIVLRPANASRFFYYLLANRIDSSFTAEGSNNTIRYQFLLHSGEKFSDMASLHMDLNGNQDYLSINEMTYTYLDGLVDASGSFHFSDMSLQASFRVDNLSISKQTAPVNGIFKVYNDPVTKTIMWNTKRLRVADTVFTGASFSLQYADQTTFRFLLNEYGMLRTVKGQIKVEKKHYLAAQVSLNKLSIHSLQNIAATLLQKNNFWYAHLVGFPLNAQVSSTMEFSVQRLDWELYIPHLRVWNYNDNKTSIAFSTKLSPSIIEVSDIDLILYGKRLIKKGTFLLKRDMFSAHLLTRENKKYTITGNATYQDITLRVVPFTNQTPKSDLADAGIMVRISPKENGTWMGSIQAKKFPLFWRKKRVYFDTHETVTWGNNQWQLYVPYFRLSTEDIGNLFSLRANLTHNGGKIYEVSLTTPKGSVLMGGGRLSLENNIFSSLRLHLSDTEEAFVELDVENKKENIFYTFSVQNIPFNYFVNSFSGVGNCFVSYDGRAKILTGKLGYTFPGNDAIFLKSNFSWDGKDIVLSKLRGRKNEKHIATDEIRISLKTHAITGLFYYKNDLSNMSNEIVLQGNLDNGTEYSLNTLLYSPFEIFFKTVSPMGQSPVAFNTISISRSPIFLRIFVDENTFFLYHFEKQKFHFALNKSESLHVSGEGSIGNVFKTTIHISNIDVGKLGGISLGSFLSFHSGKIRGDLTISGSLNDPDVHGTIQYSEMRGNTVFSPSPVGPAQAVIRFQGKKVTILPFYFANGAGYGKLSAEFLFEKRELQQFSFRLQAEESPGLNIHYIFGTVDANGFVTGEIRVGWEKDKGITLTGDITTGDAQFSLVEVMEYPEIDKMNLLVRAGRANSFTWPKTGTPVVRGYLEPHDYIRIFASSNDDIRIKGDLGLRGGEIMYFNRLFLVKDGNLYFDTSKLSIAPLLTVKAEARVRDTEEHQTVRIYLQTTNSPVTDLSPTFSSNPPLPPYKIVQLLGDNLYEGDVLSGYFKISDALAATVDHYGGVSQGIKKFESFMRDILKVDVFTLRTPLIRNLFRSTILLLHTPLGGGRSNSDAVSASSESFLRANYTPFNISYLLDDTTLTLGRYLGKDVFVEFSLALDTSGYRYEKFSTLKVNTEFRMEFNTPFFFLEWIFSPRNRASFFVPDNKISLSWKVSY